MNHFLAAVLVPFTALLPFVQSLNYTDIFLKHLEYPLTLAGRAATFPERIFWSLFIFRYLRLVVHIISFWCFYKPIPAPQNATILPQDASIIIPTVDIDNPDLHECVESCLANDPRQIIFVTVGQCAANRLQQFVHPYRQSYPDTEIQVLHTNIASKRIQVAHGLQSVTGRVTVLVDDHVFWPSPQFLPTILAPFEDPKVGVVGTNKRVRRTHHGYNFRSFWNMMGAIYLERHNFEIRATNAIDGGVFVISGRTAAYRTSILRAPDVIDGFVNERFFFNKFGPLLAGDDNYLTRSVVNLGYDIKIQYCDDARIETTLGTYPKYLAQCLRWVRTTWISNSGSLFADRTVWYRQPWCVYAVYFTSFVNFALFYDAALVYSLSLIADRSAVSALLVWIFMTKMVKLIPYFIREPQDLLMLPGYFAFAYYHSLIKLYALFTFGVLTWGGRDLNAINNMVAAGDGGDDGDDDDDDDDNDDHDDGNNSDPASSPYQSARSSVDSGRNASSSSGGSSDSSSDYYTAFRRRMLYRTNAASPVPGSNRSSASGVSPGHVNPFVGAVQTPWGAVDRSANLHSVPADVLESHLPVTRTSPKVRPQPQQIQSVLPTRIVNPDSPITFSNSRERNGTSGSSSTWTSSPSSIPFVGTGGRRVSTFSSLTLSRSSSLANSSGFNFPTPDLRPVPVPGASMSTVNLPSPVLQLTFPTSNSRVEPAPSDTSSSSSSSSSLSISPTPSPSDASVSATPTQLPTPRPTPARSPISPTIPTPTPSTPLSLSPSSTLLSLSSTPSPPPCLIPASAPIPISTPACPSKPIYDRTWLRGPLCNQLHYESHKLCPASGTCLVEDVFTVGTRYKGHAVVDGRPRF